MARILKEAWRRLDKFLKVDVNPDTIVLSDFVKSPSKTLQRWRVFSDATFGGNSRGALTASEDGKHAVFAGRYSKLINEGSPLVRAGYVGINTVLSRPANLSLHDYLEFRVRSADDHTYVASVRTDQYTGGDEEAWQAPLTLDRSQAPSEWQDVRIPLDDFVFTFRGRLVQQQAAFARMPRQAVVAVGVTLAATKDMPDEGDFRLELAHVSAGAHYVTGVAEERKAMAGYMHVAHTIEDERAAERELLRKRQQAGSSGADADGAVLECLGGAKSRGRWGAGSGTGAGSASSPGSSSSSSSGGGKSRSTAESSSSRGSSSSSSGDSEQ